MADYATLLRDYVTLTCRSVDRIFLQAYVPKLQCVGGVCQSLVTLDYTSATGLLEVTSQVTAVTAPASRLRPIDVSHVHPGGQSSVSSSVGPLQVPARDQPGQGLLAGTSPTAAGSTQCRVPLAWEPARCMSKARRPVKVRWQAPQ
jgi:hypothetical protein